ncbi:carboxypeptidase-like regulatory domain-containing protein [Granulicella sp. dw_53]|uniref:carboxypeptidase-like regulatory domain-containing protein n=1 Tax=Granulicella sp. dw_53 TaxID=2719792 RepID=UPI001BD67D1A|nr:carboxypeptidase-like regulatory domain-containing protein [Granulicella sp. dw_53]
MELRRFRYICLCLLILFGTAQLRADVTGSILGYVRDSSGAAVPKAPIVITNLGTNVVREALTNNDGQYNFVALPPGKYKIVATVTGFQSSSINNVDLKVNDQLQFDFALNVGDVQQNISVEANAVQVQTSSTQLGGTIESKEMLALPLNGRSYLDLLGLQAGVAPRSATAATDRPVGGLFTSPGNVSVNGQPESANAFLVNGGDVSETKNNGAGLIPNIDSVQEFRLITNSFDAEYGKFTGAVMNTITKSGTNSFHGDAFEFLRNNAMDARGYFDPVKATLKRHQYGYAIGGPFWRNRLFWFTDFQGTRQTSGASTGNLGVPSDNQRSGIFSATAFGTKTVNGTAWAAVLSQRLGRPIASGTPYSTVFPGGVIPAAAFDPISVKELGFIPRQTGNGVYSNSSLNNKVTDNKIGQRVDFANAKTGNWSFYYHFDDSTAFNQFQAGFVPGFALTSPSRAQMFMLSNTKSIGATMVNEVRATFFRTAINTAQPDTSSPGNQATLSGLGFVTGPNTLGIVKSGPAGYPEAMPPNVFNNFTVGNPLTNMKSVDNNYMLTDTFSKILGNHSLSTGGEYRYYQLNVRNVCAPNGQFKFDGTETNSDFADFLLGAPATYTQCSQQLLDNRARYGGLFAQDSWKAKSNLTLNIGLRWDVAVPWYDKYSQLNTFVPGVQSKLFPLAPLGYLVPGDPGVSKSISPTFWDKFAPRLGVAYSPNFNSGVLGKVFGGPGKSSIRSAFGIYYLGAADSGNFGVIGSAPWGQYWSSLAPTNFAVPFQTRSNATSQTQRFPFVAPRAGDPANATLDFSKYEPIVGPAFNVNNRLTYAEHYNLSIQRQLSNSTVLTMAYVGTQSHNLPGDLNLNPGNPDLCLQLARSGATPVCGPNGEKQVFTNRDGSKVYGTLQGMGNQQLGTVAFGRVRANSNIAHSNYNALQLTVERKASNFSVLGAYTYSKSIDNSTTVFDPADYRHNRALSPYDLTHNFVASYTVTMPFERVLRSVPDRITKGWSFSGISRFATGFPVTLTQSGDISLNTMGFDFPNVAAPLVKSNPRNPGNQYFNKSAYSTELPGTIGNSGPRPFHGPGIINTDAGLGKSTRITESTSIIIRGEFFNVFNHANFLNPVGNFASSQFGQITTASPARIGQVSAKFIW